MEPLELKKKLLDFWVPNSSGPLCGISPSNGDQRLFYYLTAVPSPSLLNTKFRKSSTQLEKKYLYFVGE